MHILVAPDKFKGSLTSFEAGEAIAAGIRNILPEARVQLFPMADGGDGFAAVMKYYLHTVTREVNTVDPLGRALPATYEWHESSKTAIIEMAAASGLELLQTTARNPLHTSTFGTGLQIADALRQGAENIILGLGGSATNDAGIGVLSALGFIFLDRDGQRLAPTGGNLVNIDRIVPPASLPKVKFELACDVQNPMYGPDGAAYVYAAQKGASPEDIQWLDKGLRHFDSVIQQQCGRSVAAMPGTGAAGAIAAGLLPWMAVTLVSGVKRVAEVSGIHEALKDANLVITGEGKLDRQSAQGKVVGYLAQTGRAHGIPVAALCGTLDTDEIALQALGLSYASAILKPGMPLAFCLANAATLLTAEVPALIAGLPAARRY